MWIDRLGSVWVEAQVIEINRRAGTSSVFLTLRDRLAQVSASVRVSTATLDSAGPLSENATVVARLKPAFYEARVSSPSIATPSPQWVKVGCWRSWSNQAPAPSGGPVRSCSQTPPANPATSDRADHRCRQRGRAGRGGQRAPPLACRPDRDSARTGSRSAGGRSADGGDTRPGRESDDRRDRDRSRRRFARGLVALLR